MLKSFLKKNTVAFLIISSLIYSTFYILIPDSYADLKDFQFQPQRRTLIFVEDYYSLYRQNLYHNTDAHLANIYYLKTALIKAEKNKWWAHPVKTFSYAGYNWTNSTQIYTEAHHAKYKELMKMRLSLLLTKSYLKLGARYDKENIYWFNAENIENTTTKNTTNKKEHYLIRGFRIAKIAYIEAGKYFFKTKEYVRKLIEDEYVNNRLKKPIPYNKINLEGPELDSMQDETYKIYFGGSMLEKDTPSIKQDREIKLKVSKEHYKQKVQNYKKEKKYYNKKTYPEYNYSKIIRDKINALSTKQKKLKKLIETLKNK